MLPQLLIHPGKLQGPTVEVLNWSDGAQLKAEQGLEGSYQGGPGGSPSFLPEQHVKLQRKPQWLRMCGSSP